MKGITDRELTTPLSAERIAGMEGETVTLHGAVQRIRRLGWGAFIILRRHDGLLQCVIGNEGNEDVLENLETEQSISVTGLLKGAKIKDSSIYPRTVEMQVDSLRVISSPADQSPVDMTKKLLDLHIDTNLDLRPLSLRHPVERARIKITDTLAAAFRESLAAQGFTEIHTPKICSAGAEGGAIIFMLMFL
jgi:nondiscriminating aspartyl-tRNA synthetase